VVNTVNAPISIFNLGTDEHCTVDDSLGWICEAMGLNPTRRYTGGERGWIGDSPFIFLDCSRVRSLGWAPKLTIREGVMRTLAYLRDHSGILLPS
jgi:UDP-glucose 4-epimerase